MSGGQFYSFYIDELTQGGAEPRTPVDCQWKPTEMHVECRKPPAGGELGLAICSPLGSSMFMREKEGMCNFIHNCQGLAQIHKGKKNIVLLISIPEKTDCGS